MEISDVSTEERLYLQYVELSKQIQFIENEAMPLKEKRHEIIKMLRSIYKVDASENPTHDFVIRKVIFDSGYRRLKTLNIAPNWSTRDVPVEEFEKLEGV
jgi:hypothetical protein